MQISVNGQRHNIPPATSLAELLAQLKLEPRRLAVERNRTLVPRTRFAETALAEGDVLEIVTLVGGG